MKFTVYGKPIGYHAPSGRRDFSKRAMEYKAYCERVRLSAKQAGISLPLHATKAAPLMVNTTAYFGNGVHCDPGNVQKGVTDALFYRSKDSRAVDRLCGKKDIGGDKFCGGSFPPPLYDGTNPRVVVEIQSWNGVDCA